MKENGGSYLFFPFSFEARSLAVPFRTTFIMKSPCFQALEARRED